MAMRRNGGLPRFVLANARYSETAATLNPNDDLLWSSEETVESSVVEVSGYLVSESWLNRDELSSLSSLGGKGGEPGAKGLRSLLLKLYHKDGAILRKPYIGGRRTMIPGFLAG